MKGENRMKDISTIRRTVATMANQLHKIVMFLCSNIGSITSPNSIGNVLADEGDIQKTKGKT